MRARLLVMHRRERYDGEYAPEILAVVDEWTLDDNPRWWPQEVRRLKADEGSDAEAWAEVEIELDGDALMSLLYPDNRLKATLLTDESATSQEDA